jgi:hypothetical protein
MAGAISCWRDPRENQLYTRQLHSKGVMTPVAEGWTRDTTTRSAATKTSHNIQLSRPQSPLEAGPGPKQPGAMDTIDPWWVDTTDRQCVAIDTDLVKRAYSVLLNTCPRLMNGVGDEWCWCEWRGDENGQ